MATYKERHAPLSGSRTEAIAAGRDRLLASHDAPALMRIARDLDVRVPLDLEPGDARRIAEAIARHGV